MLVAGLVAGGSSAALADIAGSAHDLRSYGWSGGEICIVCHTPHDADTTVSASPLWNHEVTTATYTLYSSPTMDVTVNQPGAESKLCLSCHDGTVALDSFGGATGSTYIDSGALIDTDLSDDHPVGIDWFHQTLSATPDCSGCHQISPSAFVGPPFFAGRLECATCHDVHNREVASEPGLLRRTLAGSELCLWCHEDK
jgi:predicted CXXCH cytochrome family protein